MARFKNVQVCYLRHAVVSKYLARFQLLVLRRHHARLCLMRQTKTPPTVELHSTGDQSRTLQALSRVAVLARIMGFSGGGALVATSRALATVAFTTLRSTHIAETAAGHMRALFPELPFSVDRDGCQTGGHGSVRVSASSIHGRGLFSVEGFSYHEPITDYAGALVLNEVSDACASNEDEPKTKQRRLDCGPPKEREEAPHSVSDFLFSLEAQNRRDTVTGRGWPHHEAYNNTTEGHKVHDWSDLHRSLVFDPLALPPCLQSLAVGRFANHSKLRPNMVALGISLAELGFSARQRRELSYPVVGQKAQLLLASSSASDWRIFFVASRPITLGEELTFAYGEYYNTFFCMALRPGIP